MKKIFLLVSVFSLMVFSSCSEDDSNDLGGRTSYLFSTTESDLSVSNTGVSEVEIEIGVTTRTNADRTIGFSIDPSSTATPNQYTIDASSLVIPAGQYTTKVKVTGNFDNLEQGVTSTLILNLDVDGDVMPGKGVHTVSIYRFCLSDLAGNYSVTTTYGFHDFLPTYATNTMNVEIFANPVENSYYVLDFSGGLYSTGPYCPAYNTCNNPNNRMDFQVNCNTVSWTGQTEPYGPLVMDGPSTYNPVTGVITLRWRATAYGEFATSVYTPL
ncbi:MAG: hypothetical protein Q8K02_11015 [Flavobacterium sp.]|jgi:hypothetical protein|nr:hypothetical protein [Flavobacterium sp.]